MPTLDTRNIKKKYSPTRNTTQDVSEIGEFWDGDPKQKQESGAQIWMNYSTWIHKVQVRKELGDWWESGRGKNPHGMDIHSKH